VREKQGVGREEETRKEPRVFFGRILGPLFFLLPSSPPCLSLSSPPKFFSVRQ
jgi:hypothetical protein